MEFQNLVQGNFCKRVNRFVAEVEINGTVEICHVKNTGRLRELLVPGATVYCEAHPEGKRKTKFSLLLVQHGTELVCVDSQAPNRLAWEFVSAGGLGFVPEQLRREVTHGDSRFDLYLESGVRRGFVEVKGVTLVQDGISMFPDAPTERGTKHLRGLADAVKDGYDAWALFIVQRRDVTMFMPNDAGDSMFGTALREAAAAGVQVMAVTCEVTETGSKTAAPIPVRL